MHIHMPLKFYFFDNFNHLTMLMFVDGLLSFISLPSFMFVSAAVSDIRELNLNKEEEVENGNLTPFPGLQFHLSYLLTFSTH